jgi:hypothetical protein
MSHLLFDLKYSAQKDIVATIHKQYNTSPIHQNFS